LEYGKDKIFVSDFGFNSKEKPTNSDFAEEPFLVFPNPASKNDVINVIFPNDASRICSIYDNTGKLLYSEKMDSEFNMMQLPSSLSSGIYNILVKEEFSSVPISKKLIIK
jgi:hypothetical protein